jgi:hypothetical protein
MMPSRTGMCGFNNHASAIEHFSGYARSANSNSIPLHSCQGAPPPNLSSRPERSVAEGPAVCVNGETEPGGNPSTAHSLGPKVKPQVPPLRYPGFPVEVGGVGGLHAAFLTESRTRRRWGVLRSRKSGYAPVGMTRGRAALTLAAVTEGWTERHNSNQPGFVCPHSLQRIQQVARPKGRLSANLDSSREK